jgi:hypothetical protein
VSTESISAEDETSSVASLDLFFFALRLEIRLRPPFGSMAIKTPNPFVYLRQTFLFVCSFLKFFSTRCGTMWIALRALSTAISMTYALSNAKLRVKVAYLI